MSEDLPKEKIISDKNRGKDDNNKISRKDFIKMMSAGAIVSVFGRLLGPFDSQKYRFSSSNLADNNFVQAQPFTNNPPANYIPIVYHVDGSTEKLQKLTGENDRLNPNYFINKTQSRFGVLGTDLGTPIEHNGKLYFLFGDTILGIQEDIRNNQNDIVDPSGVPGHFAGEDCIGWTTSADPKQGVSLEFVSAVGVDGKNTYVSPKIYKNVIPLFPGFLQVPTGGFSANERFYVIYSLKNEDIKDPLYDNDFLALKKDGMKAIGIGDNKRIMDDRTGQIIDIINYEVMWKAALCSAFNFDPERSKVGNNIIFNYIYELSNIYNKIENLPNNILRTGHVVDNSGKPVRDDKRNFLILDLDRFTDFDILGKFIHVSAVVVNNYSTVEVPSLTRPILLLWGIGLFRRSSPYLAFIPLDNIECKENIMYYAGREEGSHRIIWSTSEKDAIPLFDHPVVGEFNVSWNHVLGLWVLLYNNDTDPSLMNKPTYIQFRTALNPFGPWSEPRILFDPSRDDNDCNIIFYQWNPNCRAKLPPSGSFDDAERTGNLPKPPFGNPYAPIVIPRFTKQNGMNSEIYYVMSTWYPYNTVLMKSELRPDTNISIKYSYNPVLIQSNFGIKGNFELVCSFRPEGSGDARLTFGGGGLVRFFRNNDHKDLPWSNFTPATPSPFPSDPPATIDDFKFPLFENITFIQSNFGSDNFDKPANLEVIGRIDNRLKHVWRESKYPFPWRNTKTFLQIQNSYDLTGVTGNPSLIQSRFGNRNMNFELTVPLIAGGFYHLFKSNDGDNPSLSPWQIGNNGIPIDHGTRYEALSLIQSNYGSPENPGNLELIARTQDKLAYFWLDSSKSPPEWIGPLSVMINGAEIQGITGIPSFVQSTSGQKGNFELVVPIAAGGFMYYTRDNDALGDPQDHWFVGNNGNPIATQIKYQAVSLIQSDFKSNASNPGNLEVAALTTDGSLHHFWMDSGTKIWSGPEDFASF